jgi:hypothetical protein
MFTDSALPATSAPVLALTSLTVCVALFPARQMRPSAVTLIALPPTVNFIPTHPPKLFRTAGLFSAYPVMKAVAPPPPPLLAVKLAV